MGDIQSSLIGATEANFLFFLEKARKNKPAIIIIDEIDSIINKKEGTIIDDRLIKTLLTFMNGTYDSSGVLIIGTTNFIERIPDAFLRDGRFSHKIKIDLPSFKDRVDIIKKLIKKYKILLENKELITYIAKKFNNFNNADICGMIKKIARLQKKDFEFVLSKNSFNDLFLDYHVKMIENNNKNIDLETLRNLSLHEAGHAIVHFLSEKQQSAIYEFDFVTINRMENSLGSSHGVYSEIVTDITKEKLKNQIRIYLAGRIAKELYGHKTLDSGASSDLSQANSIASDMIMKYGMGSQLSTKTEVANGIQLAPLFNQEINNEIENILQEEYKFTTQLLIEYEIFLKNVAQKLIEKKILYKEDLEEIYAQSSTNKSL